MWGTGYYYPPYYYGGIYYPFYPTYGFGASYNPWTGAYTRGAVAYGPYGGAGVAQRYNPRTGTYSRGAVVHGPYGSRGAASAYNPRTGTGAATRQGSNVYGSWGTTGVRRGDDWAATSRYTNNITGNTTRVTRTSDGDVYAGRDGNVYRKDGDGLAEMRQRQLGNVATPGQPGRRRIARRAGARPRPTSQLDSASRIDRDSAARAGRAAHPRLRSDAEREQRHLARSAATARRWRASGGGGGRRR